VDVAVRSSATAEDLPGASFAGQQETYLNIRGERALLDTCRRCYASLFTDRAISYRQAKGIDHSKVALSVGVRRMVRSDLGGAGVMFTIDTETGFDKSVLINAAWELGENVVQGKVAPDEYEVFKPLLSEPSLLPIVGKKLGGKGLKMIYANDGGHPTKNVPTSKTERAAFVLSDKEILILSRWACVIEQHYEVMAQNGIRRGEASLKIYVMCEIPSNVILAKAFAQRFDGFSIGSNDLTQLTLGVDRDSADLAEPFDEQDDAVKWMIQSVIAKAHEAGAHVGLCGQAPSDHPEFAAFLVECGIDSISVSPDSFIAIKRTVAAAESAARKTA